MGSDVRSPEIFRRGQEYWPCRFSRAHKKPVRSRYGTPKNGSLLYKFTRQLPEIDKIKISEINTYRVDNRKPAPKVKSVVLEGDEAILFVMLQSPALSQTILSVEF
jgi:hypothetical protein